MKQNKRFVSDDGNILRNKVYEPEMQCDVELLKILLADEKCREIFFTDVGDIKVFDQVKFALIINNRQFLPDSYTSFKNKSRFVDENETAFPNPITLSWSSLTKIACWKAVKPKTIIDRLLVPNVLTCANTATLQQCQICGKKFKFCVLKFCHAH